MLANLVGYIPFTKNSPGYYIKHNKVSGQNKQGKEHGGSLIQKGAGYILA